MISSRKNQMSNDDSISSERSFDIFALSKAKFIRPQFIGKREGRFNAFVLIFLLRKHWTIFPRTIFRKLVWFLLSDRTWFYGEKKVVIKDAPREGSMYFQNKLQNRFEINSPTDSKFFQNKPQNGFKIKYPTNSKFFQDKLRIKWKIEFSNEMTSLQNKSQNGFKIINPTNSKFFQDKSQIKWK